MWIGFIIGYLTGAIFMLCFTYSVFKGGNK